jgi:hypothetical protein
MARSKQMQNNLTYHRLQSISPFKPSYIFCHIECISRVICTLADIQAMRELPGFVYHQTFRQSFTHTYFMCGLLMKCDINIFLVYFMCAYVCTLFYTCVKYNRRYTSSNLSNVCCQDMQTIIAMIQLAGHIKT